VNAIKLIADFVMAVAWPVSILVIFFCIKGELLALLRLAQTRLSSGRGLKARLGSFELDFGAKQELEKIGDELADESDPKKRLRRAQILAKKQSILAELTEADVQALQESQTFRCPEAFLPDWFRMSEDERSRMNGLISKGLVSTFMIYNDELCYFTPLGQEVAKTLGIGEKLSTVSGNAEQGGPANGSQPIPSETNRTSSAAGSRR